MAAGHGQVFEARDLHRLYTRGSALYGVAALHHLLNTSRKDAEPKSPEVMRRLFFFASSLQTPAMPRSPHVKVRTPPL